jgi:hypothetical protein
VDDIGVFSADTERIAFLIITLRATAASGAGLEV